MPFDLWRAPRGAGLQSCGWRPRRPALREERVPEDPRTVENPPVLPVALEGGPFCPQPPDRRLRPRLAALQRVFIASARRPAGERLESA